jgi:hypothetical protein
MSGRGNKLRGFGVCGSKGDYTDTNCKWGAIWGK